MIVNELSQVMDQLSQGGAEALEGFAAVGGGVQEGADAAPQGGGGAVEGKLEVSMISHFV